MLVLISLLAVLGIVYGTYVHYLAIMHLAKFRDRLTLSQKIFGYAIYGVGLVLDIVLNLLLSLLLLQVPRQLLVTSRLSCLKTEAGWRGKFARWVCYDLLDPFDPKGEHCRHCKHGGKH